MGPETKPEVRQVDIKQLEERFKSFLYAKHGKVTNERLALLRTLYLHNGHFSVDQLLALMAKNNLSISRATVYRTLDLLVQSGLVKKLAIEDRETRYESALDSGHHDHIICVDCNKIIEFYNPELEEIQDQILGIYQLKPVKHIHQLYGSCLVPDCPEKQAAGSSSRRSD